MLLLISTIFVASLIGSLHCAGMCGAFVAIAVAGEGVSKVRLQVAYHLGRLVTYTLLGFAAGAAGALVNIGGSLAGFTKVAMFFAGGVMVLFGVSQLLVQRGVGLAWLKPPAWLTGLVIAVQKRAFSFKPLPRAAVIGLATTLLPCGWLYAFAATAAGTGHPLTGGLVMVVFWGGTLPVLVSLGAGVQHLLGAVGQRLPLITSCVLIGVGLWTLAGRAGLDAQALAAASSLHTHEVIEGSEVPPCCK